MIDSVTDRTTAARSSALAEILQRKRLPALNGLRAVVMLPVVVYHFGYAAPAGLSVTMFFVLSGFLITWLLLKEFDSSKDISISSFYVRRTLRIFPAYYAFIFASIAVDRFVAEPWTGSQMLATLTYTTNYYNAFFGHNATPTAHAWSLAVEEQFYLLWPLALLLLLKRGHHLVSVVLLASIVAAPIWRTVLYSGFGLEPDYIYNAFDTRYDTLAIGCLMAMLSRRQTFLSVAEAVARRTWYPVLTLLALGASHRFATPEYSYTIRFTIDSLLLGVLLIQLLQLYSRREWRWLEHPVTDYLGTISYPMYLWHAWAISVGRDASFLPKFPQLLIAVIAMVGFGAFSYHVIERPALATRPRIETWLRNRGRRATSQVAIATVD